MLLVLMVLLVNFKSHVYVTYVMVCFHWLALRQVTEGL